jgi:hypothetical protein
MDKVEDVSGAPAQPIQLYYGERVSSLYELHYGGQLTPAITGAARHLFGSNDGASGSLESST